ncbi:MAG TPA: tRNA (adenosine(37)-N6)-dimethylallyltransferase MiaA [Candidatus Dojkabacteria bacterium]|nr:tRNA (adenosine(37)-N6)-dimethylallyltransferase MiaA [Candidatus Dojkabacteria bacterium]
MAKPIIVIYGTTGTGKSSLAISMARALGTSIISADSRKIYKELTIGTHKDELIEAKTKYNIPVYGIDLINPDESFNAFDFIEHTNPICDKILKEGKIPIIVGGTVMYITALINNYTLRSSKPNPKLRATLENKTLEELQAKVKKINIKSWNNLNESEQKNKRRLIRWIEILSEDPTVDPKQKLRNNPKYRILPIKLNRNIDELRNLLPHRVERMIKQGLIEETQKVLKKYHPDSPGLKTMGYPEIIKFLDNQITLEEMKLEIVRRHVKYAKYQIRWIKKYL